MWSLNVDEVLYIPVKVLKFLLLLVTSLEKHVHSK
jgi:hypothetical protein